MNKKEAKKLIEKWVTLSRKNKAKNWDKLVPYINKYPDIYLEAVTKGRCTKNN